MGLKESEDGEYVLISKDHHLSQHNVHVDLSKHLPEINSHIDGLQDTLWPLNRFLHDNPELAFKEHKAHDALTNCMNSRAGWTVHPHAYGIETAWTATFSTGRDGPVVAFNAEMGMRSSPVKSVDLTTLIDAHY